MQDIILDLCGQLGLNYYFQSPVSLTTGVWIDDTDFETLLAVLLLTSKGAAGVTGSGFIVLAATLSAVGHVPVAGLALILGIDRFMSEARALTNMIGNGIACVVVGHWCREVDNDKLKVMMHSKKKYHENEDAS